MINKDSITVPKPGADDLAHKSVKAVLGAVPMAGTGLAEFFELVVAPPLRRKQDAWMANMSAAIWDLKARVEGFEPEKLAESPVFAPAVLVATQAAMKTTDEQKLAALRNALLNVAIRPDANSIEWDLFGCLIDRLTPFHLQVLHSLKEYSLRRDERGGELPKAEEFPAIAANVDLAEIAARDLTECHLLSVPRNILYSHNKLIFTSTAGGLGLNHVKVSDLGTQFLEFISAPGEKGG